MGSLKGKENLGLSLSLGREEACLMRETVHTKAERLEQTTTEILLPGVTRIYRRGPLGDGESALVIKSHQS